MNDRHESYGIDVRVALTVLAVAWDVGGVTLWELQDARLVASCIRDSDEDATRAAQRAWSMREAELRAGRTLQAAGTELHPLRGVDSDLVGVVQTRRLGSVSPARQAMAGVALEELARLLDRRARAEALFADVASARTRARLIEERAQLVRLLDRMQWVFTRAARHLGVTRQTIRNRVVRLRIQVPEWACHGKRRKPVQHDN